MTNDDDDDDDDDNDEKLKSLLFFFLIINFFRYHIQYTVLIYTKICHNNSSSLFISTVYNTNTNI